MSEAADRVLVVDRRSRGTIEVTGADRIAWLDAIVTSDLGRLQSERGIYGLLLNRLGKIQTDLDIVAGRDRVLVGVAPGRMPEVLPALDQMLIMEDADLADVSARWTWVSIHGDRALAVARACAAEVEGIAAAMDWMSEGGATLVVLRSVLDRTLQVLEAQPGVAVADDAAWLRYRLERGFPEFGLDYGVDDNPHQARLERSAVCWTKGCYVGQEVVCKVDMRGQVRRRLATVILEREHAPLPGTPVAVAGSDVPVGQVTSAATNQQRGIGIAMVKVPRAVTEPGTGLVIDGINGTVIADPR